MIVYYEYYCKDCRRIFGSSGKDGYIFNGGHNNGFSKLKITEMDCPNCGASKSLTFPSRQQKQSPDFKNRKRYFEINIGNDIMSLPTEALFYNKKDEIIAKQFVNVGWWLTAEKFADAVMELTWVRGCEYVSLYGVHIPKPLLMRPKDVAWQDWRDELVKSARPVITQWEDKNKDLREVLKVLYIEANRKYQEEQQMEKQKIREESDERNKPTSEEIETERKEDRLRQEESLRYLTEWLNNNGSNEYLSEVRLNIIKSLEE